MLGATPRRTWTSTGGRADIDLELIRGSGLRVLERRRFRARSRLSVPEPRPALHSTITHVVDLDRRLSTMSTVTALDPEDADEQPFLSEPITLWCTREGLLVPLPPYDAADPVWGCVPGEPLIAGPLALLLLLVGAVTARPTTSGAGWRTVVDVDRAVEHVPAGHRGALQHFLRELLVEDGWQQELEVRLSGRAVDAVDAELPAVAGSRSRVLLHLSIDADEAAALPDPPVAGTVADGEQIARMWATDWSDDVPVIPPRRRS
jgi:hypothetical protein